MTNTSGAARQVFCDQLLARDLLRHCRLAAPATTIYFLECRGLARILAAVTGCMLRGVRLLAGGILSIPVTKPVPDGEAEVPDFANVHAAAFSKISDILKRHGTAFTVNPVGVSRFLEPDAVSSYQCRVLGPRLRFLVFALLKFRDMRTPLQEILLRNRDISPSIADALAQEVTPGLYHARRRLPDPVAFAALMLGLLPLLRSAIFPRKAGSLARYSSTIDIVHELPDPNLRRGSATSPEYVVGDDDPDRFLFYVREEQERSLGYARAVWRQRVRHIVFLSDLVFAAPDARYRYGAVLVDLAIRALSGRMSGSRLHEEIGTMRRFLAWTVLFSRSRAKASLHSSFLNGDTPWHHDGAVLTSVARNSGVLSVGYQTRCTHLRNFEELFEHYDMWCGWGDAWIQVSEQYGSLQRSVAIGDVNLDELSARIIQTGERKSENKIFFDFVVFPTSLSHIDYFTEAYLVETVTVVLRAAGQMKRKDGSNPRIWIKVKDLEDIAFYDGRADLQALAAEEGVPLACLRAARFDIADAIAMADAVVSVGFTTPGVDALLMGKPSYYFTILRDVHPAFAADASFVVRTAEELYAKVRIGYRPGVNELARFDPFRDGRSGARLRQACRSGGGADPI